MPLRTPESALVSALTAHLQDVVDDEVGADTVTVTEEWPDDREDQPAGIQVVITHGRLAETPVNPFVHTEDDGDRLTCVAAGVMPVQVDIFAPHKDIRDELAPVLRAALSPRRGHPFLTLTLDDYHGISARLRVNSGSPVDDEDAMLAREWRYAFELTAEIDVVMADTFPVIADTSSITTTLSTDLDI